MGGSFGCVLPFIEGCRERGGEVGRKVISSSAVWRILTVIGLEQQLGSSYFVRLLVVSSVQVLVARNVGVPEIGLIRLLL